MFSRSALPTARLALRASTWITNIAAAARINAATTSTSLSQTPVYATLSRSFGIMDKISSKAQEIQEKRQEDSYKKAFPETMKQLAAVKADFNIDDYRNFLTDQVERAGLNGWKSKIPGMASQAEDAKREVDRQLKVIDAFLLTERKYPESIDRVSKGRVSAATGLPVSEINVILRSFDRLANMSKWLKSLQAKNVPIPTSKEEMDLLSDKYPLAPSKMQLELHKKMMGGRR